jgi:hypothetical protein
MWTYKLDPIFLRVSIQSGPTRVSNSYDVFRMRIAVHGQKTSNKYVLDNKAIDAVFREIDAARLFFLRVF